MISRLPTTFSNRICETNKIEFTDYLDDKIISTRTIPTLKITDDKGNEIRGLGTNVVATNTDSSEVTIEGIPYPFYGEEFSHHVKADAERFK